MTNVRHSGSGKFATSSDVPNASFVSGSSVTDALNTLLSGFATITSTMVSNLSGVVGATVTAALDTLNAAIAALTSTNIANASGVAGATVTAALDALNAKPPALRTLGYTAAAPLTVTLLAAGHVAGNYEISHGILLRVAAATGSMNRSLGFSAPTAGATTVNAGTVNLTAVPPNISGTFAVYSNGVAAITLTYTPVAPTGAPVLDLTYQAILIGT